MYSGDLLVWLSDADGVPVYVDRVASEQWAGVVTVADVTGDGTADLLQIAPYPEDIYSYPELLLFEGAGDGTFASPIVIPGGSWRVWPEEPPQVGDFDLDGDPDIATQGCVFDAAADALTAQLGCSLDAETSVAAGDLNGDGWPDLVMVGTAWYIESYVRLSDGAGGYDPVVLGGIMDRHGAIADVDGDGHLDVVLSGDEAPRLALGDGAGNFSTTSMSFEDGACTYSAVQAADLNGDGDAELMCLDITGQILRVFDASGAQTNALPMAGSTWPPSLGDTAGDGLIDVVRGTMDVSLTHASIGD
jgi:hypothetical protein